MQNQAQWSNHALLDLMDLSTEHTEQAEHVRDIYRSDLSYTP